MSTFALKLSAAKDSTAWQLVLDKYPLRTAGQSVALPEKKLDALKPLTESNPKRTKEWQSAIARQQRFLATLARQHGDRFRRIPLVNSSRLLLHLGRASVLENVGLHCDRTTGLPVIPGTAVKGVVSTWACWEGNKDREEFTSKRSQLALPVAAALGANPAQDKGEPDSAGGVIFLGGFPQSPPALELDIVTPHPLEGRGRITPNPFLAIKADTKWDFVLLAAPRLDSAEAKALLEKVEAWLVDSLTQIGLGAKTAAGYGNFRSLTESEQSADKTRFDAIVAELKEAAELATMPEEEKAYRAFVKGVTDWAPVARDIAAKSEEEKALILRFFRSEEGQRIIKGWPNNEKAKTRKQALKDAGL